MGGMKVQFYCTLALKLFFLNNSLGERSYLIAVCLLLETGEPQLKDSYR